MQRQCLSVVIYAVLLDETVLPFELRQAIGRQLVGPICRDWVEKKLASLTTGYAKPPPVLSFRHCFQVWCGHLRLESLQATSNDVPFHELLRSKRRSERVIVLENRIIYRSFAKEGYMD